MFEWKSQTCRGENDYRLQIVTDDPAKYKAVEAFVQVLIDSKPVIHARWEKVNIGLAGDYATYRCSNCGRTIYSGPGRACTDDTQYGYPYCHCGAKMDA